MKQALVFYQILDDWVSRVKENLLHAHWLLVVLIEIISPFNIANNF